MQRILIVDDEDSFRHIVQLVLQRAGYATLTAQNVDEAKTLLGKFAVDLILLDDMMPGMSGSDWCAQLKADEETRHIVVLMHSAHPRLHENGFAQKIGADGVLSKPCPPREIVNRVHSYLSAAAGV